MDALLEIVTVDEFIRDTTWEVVSKERMAFALDFFRSIPVGQFGRDHPMQEVSFWKVGAWNLKLRGAVRNITQWMQAIDFSSPLELVTIPAGALLQRYYGLEGISGWQRPAAWYSEVGEDDRLLALPSECIFPATYNVDAPTRALLSRTSDAHTFWGIGNEYRFGGALQYFPADRSHITPRVLGDVMKWDPDKKSKPIAPQPGLIRHAVC